MTQGTMMAERRGRGKTRQTPPPHLNPEPYIEFARGIIRRFRKMRRWSVRVTAEVSHVSASMIGQMEHGVLDASTRTLIQLALAVQVPLDMLFLPKAEGLTQDLIERIVLLDRQSQEVLFPMVEGLLNAQLARHAAESGTREHCA